MLSNGAKVPETVYSQVRPDWTVILDRPRSRGWPGWHRSNPRSAVWFDAIKRQWPGRRAASTVANAASSHRGEESNFYA